MIFSTKPPANPLFVLAIHVGEGENSDYGFKLDDPHARAWTMLPSKPPISARNGRSAERDTG
jgi:hypothetical protein